MNYEEKYNAALERAKKLQKTCDSMAVVGWCEYIFPELKESEDEEIRKWLINEIKIKHHNLDEENIEFVDKAIAWLEKQRHMLDPDKVIEWLNEQSCQGWIEDVEVDEFVDKFKKDFGL